MNAERATFDASWCNYHFQSMSTMRMEQFSEWEDLKRRYTKLQLVKVWKQKNNTHSTMEREDELVSMIRKFQGLSEGAYKRITERRQEHEAQDPDTAARAQTAVIKHFASY